MVNDNLDDLGFATKAIHAGSRKNLRLAVGLEDSKDIIEDLSRALKTL